MSNATIILTELQLTLDRLTAMVEMALSEAFLKLEGGSKTAYLCQMLDVTLACSAYAQKLEIKPRAVPKSPVVRKDPATRVTVTVSKK